MKKILVLIALSLFAVSSFASSVEFKVCGAQDVDVTVSVTDTNVVLSGFPDGDITMDNKGETVFHPGDLGDSEDLILLMMDLEDYTDGLFIAAGAGTDDVPVFIFNYGENQKAAMLLLGGLPVFLGHTDACQK